MAKPAPNTVYNFTIKGIYYAPSDNGFVRKPFEVDVVMDHEMVQAGWAHVFKRFIAPGVMREKYPDFEKLEKFWIKSKSCENPDLVGSIEFMNYDELKEYAEDEELDIDFNVYETEGKLRQAIKEYEADPEKFAKAQEKQLELHGKEIKLRQKAKALNNEDPEVKAKAKKEIAAGKPKSKGGRPPKNVV